MPIRWAYLKRVLAGAIFGMYMAHLLYFLNPQVDIAPLRLMAVTLVYALVCGLLFGTALWVLRIARVKLIGRPSPEAEYRAHGFGFVVLAAFIASAIYWIHLRQLSIYLPIGAVRVLSKATNVITGVAFALLILWLLERNADRRGSRIVFITGVVLIAISSFSLYERRESYRTEKRNVVVANVGTVAGKRPLIVVAIRNLPYDWILTMSGEGILPFIDSTARRGYFTRIEPFPTTSPDSLWASLATGKLPYRHGVTGQFSYRTPLNAADPSDRFLLVPNGVGFKIWGLIPPVKRISSQLPAGDALPLWTAFQRLSLRSELINWPSAAPTGADRVVTDDAIRSDLRGQQRAVAPVAQRFNGAGPAKQRILDGLAADLSAMSIAQGNGGFDLRVVALEGFSEAQKALHIFTNDLPPRSSMKGEALRAYAEQIDRMLASLARANPDDLIVICSPSGVVPTALPATAWSLLSQEIRADDPGADDGFVLIIGPGVAHKVKPTGAEVIDVVPTVLFAADLPVGRDMDGRILTEAFDDKFLRETMLSAIQTYEAERLVVRRTGA
ncbi:MAG TPA: alkaline phosphatase family protein [Thermoanaerobaculia bacterium]